MKNIKKIFLVLAFFTVAPMVLLYGFSPAWFALNFLGIEKLDMNITHILRVVVCLYLAFGILWLYGAINKSYRDIALLTVVLFPAGLFFNLINYLVDGQPQPLLLLYIGLEFVMVPVAYWVFKQPDCPV